MSVYDPRAGDDPGRKNGQRAVRLIDRLSALLLIRRDERSAAFYFLLVFLVIGWGSAIGRGTADALFLKRYGIDFLPLMFTLLSPLLVVLSVVYAATADRLPSERLFIRMFKLLVVLLLACWLLIRTSAGGPVYPLYYLVNEVVSELLLIHAALYLGQNFDAQQAKRLTSPIMAGTQLGAILGGLTLVQFSSVVGVGNLILVWIGAVVLAGLLISGWHRRFGPSPYYRPAWKNRRGLRPVVSEVAQGVRLLRLSPLLKVASLALFFMVVAFYVLNYSVNRVYTTTFATEAALSSFYGTLGAVTSACTLSLQLLVTGRAISRFGLRAVNLYFPAALLLVFSGLLFSMTLPFALLASFARSTIMPAFRDPVRNLFINALPDNVQGRARATSLIVVMPAALLAAGAFLWLVQSLEQPGFVLVLGLLASGAYLYYSIRMNRAYLAEIMATLKGRLHLPAKHAIGTRAASGDRVLLAQMAAGVDHPDEQVSLSFAEAAINLAGDRGLPMVLRRLPDLSEASRDRLINAIAPHDPALLRDFLRKQLANADAHGRATALKWLFRLRDQRALDRLPDALGETNPRLRATALRGVVELGLIDLYPRAAAAWQGLLLSTAPGDSMAGLELADLGVAWLPGDNALAGCLTAAVTRMLGSDDPRAVLCAVTALRHLPEDTGRLLTWLGEALGSNDLRVRLGAVHVLGEPGRLPNGELLRRALEDSHPAVREAAAGALFGGDVAALAEDLRDDRTLPPHRRASLLRRLLALDPHYPGLDELAMQWAGCAQTLARLSSDLDGSLQHAPTGRLLAALLDERKRDYIDLALEAVSPVAGYDEVAVIKAALACGDRRHIATARELLQHFANKPLAARLDRLLARHADDPARPPREAWQRLELLVESSDTWFQACVERARAEVSLP